MIWSTRSQNAKEAIKNEKIRKWHRWFAWYPIIIRYFESEEFPNLKKESFKNERIEKAWLQFVWRKKYYNMKGYIERRWVYSLIKPIDEKRNDDDSIE